MSKLEDENAQAWKNHLVAEDTDSHSASEVQEAVLKVAMPQRVTKLCLSCHEETQPPSLGHDTLHFLQVDT